MASAADREAFQRLRMRGLRPDHVDGCAALELTATRESLGWGKNLTAEEIVEARQGMADAQEAWPNA